MTYMFRRFFNETAKMDFIRAEYKSYLHRSKIEKVSEHIRHNKRFRPNALKIMLLQHRLDHISPNYFAFAAKIDEATRTVIRHLLNIFRVSPETQQKAENLYREANEFRESLIRSNGYRGYLHSTEEEIREFWVMTLMLMDKNKYE
jgi:hypothetical protein